MIHQIFKVLNTWIDRRNAYDDALLSTTRQFAIELHLAKCLHDHKPETMKTIVTIAGDFLQASDRNELKGMRDSLAAMAEWTR